MSKKKKVLKTIWRIFLLIFVSLLVGGKLYSWNAQNLVGNAMPMPFGWGVSVVLSGSMEPELHVDDVVIIRHSGSYAVDDVVVFQSGNSLVIHKIIAIDGETVTTKGVANNIADDPIRLSAIKGKAVASVPKVGAVVRFLKSPVGFFLLLIGAVVLFELPFLHQRKKADAELDKIKEEIRRLKGE